VSTRRSPGRTIASISSMGVSRSHPVEPLCKNCYAEEVTQRIYDRKIWGPAATTERRTFGEKYWQQPLKWNRDAAAANERRRVFCSSMCDVFEDHPTVTQERTKLWPLIQRTPALDWLLLTKRHDQIEANLPANWDTIASQVWLGVSIENNDYIHRADALRLPKATQAGQRWISYEPALGPLDRLDLTGITWLVFGGESGPKFRPMDVQWARDIHARCDAAGVAYFHKQNADRYTEHSIDLDGQIVRAYPAPRRLPMVNDGFTLS
jgi:protein gp37